MSNRFYIIPVLCLLFLSLMTGAAYAQDGQRVTVTGTVVDGQGEPVENGAFYTVDFIDENTIRLSDGTERKLSQDDVLTIEYEDKTEEISFSDLWEGSLPGDAQEG